MPAWNLLDSKSVGDQLQTLRTIEQNIKAALHIQCPFALSAASKKIACTKGIIPNIICILVLV